jgi:membrane protein YdbS with pleckstrin-like domain
MLIAALTPIAFLISFLLRVPGLIWLFVIGLWAFLFLFLYLFYLPARWRGVSLSVHEGLLCLHRGVFLRKSSVMLLPAIRFTRILRGPVGLLFGINTLHIAAAGGSFFMPGLSKEDARSLAYALHRGVRS